MTKMELDNIQTNHLKENISIAMTGIHPGETRGKSLKIPSFIE